MMQTFLPVPNFAESAFILDRQRLGKQRVEARQILRTLQNGGGWSNHPAVLMWKGFEEALTLYGDYMIKEWLERGFNNTLPILHGFLDTDVALPPWFGNERFHASHRSNLLRKNPDYYAQFGWEERPDLPYVWPSKENP